MISEQHKRALQRLQTQPDWAAVEAAFDAFLKQQFVVASIKRDTEFNTMWFAAECEGGKRFLTLFMNTLESLAGNARDLDSSQDIPL